ncbi:efflux transporter outer membrane subunit [Halioxenophilus aromaticivorans]|uniref:Efflux transporter outer membrane subunit n=1 Tax=Halioxenophilus aromaticivorans TaxID=1306992 RepID=A0AAV3U373_9ALTE
MQQNIADSTEFTPQKWANSAGEQQLKKARQVDWLAEFKDERLSSLVVTALNNNLDLAIAAANVEQATAAATQAGAQLKPQVNLAFANARTGNVESSASQSSSQSVSLQIGWEADLWGRIRSGQRAAVASAQAAAADYQYAQQSMAAATARAYFIAVEAGQQVAILTDILDALENTARIVNVQYKNGLASAQDVSLTNSDLASTREQLITLKASRREALRALEVLLGQYPSGDLSVSAKLPSLPAMPPAGVPAEVLERRPDLIASERRVAAAFNALQQAKAAKLPQLSLTSNIGGSSTALSEITDPSNVAWQLASNLLAPLFDGGARQAAVDSANAAQKQAVASYAQSALAAFSDVETNLDLATTLTARERELSFALKEATKAYRIASLNHKEGEIGLLDLLAVQQRVLSANSSLVSVKRLQLEQRVNLYLALGGDWAI